MRSNKTRTIVGALLGCLLLAAAVQAADLMGLWNGTWEGGGAGGRFDLTLTKNGAAVGGKVDVGQDTGDYTAQFSTASLDGNKLKARYDYTPDPQAEIVLEGAFDGTDGKGTWTMVQKGGTDAFAAGTWAVKKK